MIELILAGEKWMGHGERDRKVGFRPCLCISGVYFQHETERKGKLQQIVQFSRLLLFMASFAVTDREQTIQALLDVCSCCVSLFSIRSL